MRSSEESSLQKRALCDRLARLELPGNALSFRRRYLQLKGATIPMADKITLALEQRTLTGKKVSQLRRAGVLPATVYGKGVGPFTVQLDARTFSNVLRHAGRTSLLELEIPGQKPHSAFIHTLQR